MQSKSVERFVVVLSAVMVFALGGFNPACADEMGRAAKKKYRGLLGEGNSKVKVENGKTYLWAGGDRDPKSPKAEWYDFTGSPISPAELQFGIGKDRIKSIDDPIFVDPDDSRLRDIPASPYRTEERSKTNDDLMVIGYAEGGEARAYPTSLLDRHELVNDRFKGKPVTVGW